MISCSFLEDDPTSKDKSDTNHLNICVLGNSYSNDSFSYLPFILKEYGITCNIHIYYKGSGSLYDLYEQWYDDAPTGLADKDGGYHIRRHFSIDTRKSNRWKKNNTMSANDILKLEKWDIISMQQGGNRAKLPESYVPYLEENIHHIDSVCNYKYVRTWFMAYNGGGENRKKGSCDASLATQNDIVNTYPFELVLPVATAVFNGQETESLGVLGDSKYQRLYSSDNVHLQEGLPCYLAALTIAEAILRKYKPECSVMGNSIRPTQEWIKSINSITPNGTSIGVDEYNCELAQRLAIYANDNMFEIQFEE